jgi:hypothetical protein
MYIFLAGCGRQIKFMHDAARALVRIYNPGLTVKKNILFLQPVGLK